MFTLWQQAVYHNHVSQQDTLFELKFKFWSDTPKCACQECFPKVCSHTSQILKSKNHTPSRNLH